ncbi:hypothetical protein ACFWBH_00200 [Streptomyces sp. NPDC059999]|uniref:hypothetical protein n=1 Tax=Streptomyces sp. NPDC059999 TaxID=3347030 RepID=UPI003675CF85
MSDNGSTIERDAPAAPTVLPSGVPVRAVVTRRGLPSATGHSARASAASGSPDRPGAAPTGAPGPDRRPPTGRASRRYTVVVPAG